MSYRWDDSSVALAQRVRPYVTDRLYDSFAESGGAPALESPRAALHETATAAVTDTYLEGPSGDGRLGLVLGVAVTVSNDNGASTASTSVEVFVANSDRGWRVDAVNAS